MDRPTREHVLVNGRWSTQEKSRRPDYAHPVPNIFISVPATLTRWTGSQPIIITPLQHVAEHMSRNNVLLERTGMAQYLQQQYNWVRHPHGLIAGITPLSTPPGQAGLMYDTLESLPAQNHAHTQGVQCHRRPWQHGYSGQRHTERVHLPHPQSEDFLAQKYAMLSLTETGVAEVKPPIPAIAPYTTDTVTPEAPAPQQQPQIATETSSTSERTAAGTIGLTITTTTTGATTTRTITGPDGTVLVPPPISAHPGCELSLQLTAALQEYKVEHVCDYIQAKNLLKDKIINKVLENTQDKLKDLLQKELERMSTSEEEEEDDDDVDLLDSDMEEEAGETGRRGESEDWTFAG